MSGSIIRCLRCGEIIEPNTGDTELCDYCAAVLDLDSERVDVGEVDDADQQAECETIYQ